MNTRTMAAVALAIAVLLLLFLVIAVVVGVLAAVIPAMLAAGALLRRSTRVDVPLDLLLGYPALGSVLFLVSLLQLATWTIVPVTAVLAVYAGTWIEKKMRVDDVVGAVAVHAHRHAPASASRARGDS